MANTDSFEVPAQPKLTTPTGEIPAGQPWWNRQRGSSMPFWRYGGGRTLLPEPLNDRTWPGRKVEKAPLWCSVDLRDGNQALPIPMDPTRKKRMFDLLCTMGFKEIEVGYPSSGAADFSMVRSLVTEHQVPEDVTISVFTPARLDLIERTFESIAGAERVIVHLCMATACLWRDVVFGLSMAELRKVTIEAAEHVARLADAHGATEMRFEYSPETFNVTEPEFALEMCNAVAKVWDASPDRPVTINLPSTVETDSPNFYADQIEWMHRNLDNRESIILSVHPHNDRGTAVASAELALMAGADRVEGTLFGNGERTGNVCISTLALNLFSRGIDPQLDFSDIDGVRAMVEHCNRMPVHARHPYVGDLVYTAFSGTHQDAISKGLAALERRAAESGRPTSELNWEVPYLPIDPRDVGRTYESIVRVNSQSGKGGIAHVLKSRYGLDLPRDLRIEFSKVVQQVTDETGVEVNSRHLWELFRDEYLQPGGSLLLKEYRAEPDDGKIRVEARVATGKGEVGIEGVGEDAGRAFANALLKIGRRVRVDALTTHPIADQGDERHAAYVRLTVDDSAAWGVGIDSVAAGASVQAVLSAVNRIQFV